MRLVAVLAEKTPSWPSARIRIRISLRLVRPPPEAFDTAQLRLHVGAFEEGEPPGQPDGAPGSAVCELRVRVETRAWGIAPRAVRVVPGGDHPALLGRVMTRGIRAPEDLVVVGELLEPGGALE